jgi:hypothetical protein
VQLLEYWEMAKIRSSAVADDTQARIEAEAFADYVEGAMREIGVTGDFFCPQQRERWRQHAIRGHMGLSPEGESSFAPTPPKSPSP